VRELVMEYVRAFGDRFPQNIEPGTDASAELVEELSGIMECAVALSVRPDNPRASGMAFSGLIRRMLDTVEWSK